MLHTMEEGGPEPAGRKERAEQSSNVEGQQNMQEGGFCVPCSH